VQNENTALCELTDLVHVLLSQHWKSLLNNDHRTTQSTAVRRNVNTPLSMRERMKSQDEKIATQKSKKERKKKGENKKN
jgi:hypothetical protein